MKQLIILFVVLVTCCRAYGQQYNPDAVSPKAKRWYEKAQQAMMMNSAEDQAKVIPFLQKAISEDSGFVDAYIQVASLYERSREYAKALPYFQKANEVDSTYMLQGYLIYAKAEAGTGHFEEALQLTDRFLRQPQLSPERRQLAQQWREHYLFGLQSKKQHIPFNPHNMGDSINSVDPEYLPVLTIDQKTLIFTRNVHSRNEDFYISHRLGDSVWSKAMPLGPSINTQYNEGAQTVSQDGKILIYTICNRPDGMGSCDLYYAEKTAQGWSTPHNMGPPVNSRYWDTQPCLSPDNRELYFVSNRPGGYGGSDIYVCHLREDGTWGPPQNLGPGINTAGDESSPFIHADNQTLYFASSGWPGLGGVDLYYSRRNPDGSWGKPHDLGYPINTIDHDGSLFVAADGKTAYFASDRSDSRGKLDIYEFELYPGARPVRTLYVQGYVYNKETGARLQALLDLVDLGTGKTMTDIPTNPDGSYLVTLPVGRDYAFNVSKPGYLFYSDNFSLKDTAAGKPYHINIGLQPIRVNARITLKNIFFDFDKYSLRPESEVELDKLVRLLQQNPSVKIRIDGYTDSVGTTRHNLELSQYRAQAVVTYLESKGIAAPRLSAKGYGASHPVATNETEEGRALNRRTEVVVTAK
jgi:outer membrane protein OmpA-like peptidoglycan-associated protein/Tol biopolymer transport system component